MKYELAKKLKDAGFPQESSWTPANQRPSRYYDNKGSNVVYMHIHSGREVKMPELYELVEACGDDFWKLIRSEDGKFYAAASAKGIGSYTDSFDTPEEAVANLWLELNKKR